MEKQKAKRWQRLRKRLLLLCQIRGAKSRVAKLLKIRPAALTKILKDESVQPRAEIALTILDWVQHQESQLPELASGVTRMNTAIAHDSEALRRMDDVAKEVGL